MTSALAQSNLWFRQGLVDYHQSWFATAGQILATPTIGQALTTLGSLAVEIYPDTLVGQAHVWDNMLTSIPVVPSDHVRGWARGEASTGHFNQAALNPLTYREQTNEVGLQVPTSTSIQLGFLIGQTRLWTLATGWGGDIDTHAWFAGGYATLPLASWQLKGDILTGRTAGYSSRTLVYGGQKVKTGATINGNTTGINLQVGRVWRQSNHGDRAGVTFGLTQLWQTSRAVQEPNSPVALSLRGLTHSIDWSSVGGHYTWRVPVFNLPTWLQIKETYQYAFAGAFIRVPASYVGVPDSSFSLTGQNLPSSTLHTALDWHAKLSSQLGLAVGLNCWLGTHQFHQVGVWASLSSKF